MFSARRLALPRAALVPTLIGERAPRRRPYSVGNALPAEQDRRVGSERFVQRRARPRRERCTGMANHTTMRPWIVSRIHEALHEARLARAAADDLDDHVLVRATLRLAEDLEAFAFSYTNRLAEIEDGVGIARVVRLSARTINGRGWRPS